MTPLLRFHALGPWDADAVSIAWLDSTLRRDAVVEASIDAAWLATARPGVQLFDGPLCRLESYDASPNRLRLKFSRTSYRVFLGTNLHNAASVPADCRANAMGVSPALISADGYFLMGRRNDRVAFYPDHVHPFSGALEPAKDLDVFAEIRRELREELHFTDDDATDLRVMGIAEDTSIRQPELVAACRSRLSRREIEARVDPAEHTGLWSTEATPAGLAAAATPGNASTPFTPVARAALLLWGRGAFGETWFERTRGDWALAPSSPAT